MTATISANGARPIRRRSRTEIQHIRYRMQALLEAEHPMTVRQVFYRLVTQGVIAKTEAEYKRTVCRLLADMRRERLIPYTWIADGTRWMRKPTTYGSIEDALRETARLYRRDLWDGADERVEVWLEKEALAGVLVDVTDDWGVPLMVTRGYPSQSFLHSAAQTMVANSATSITRIYHFGDHDPSGRDIDRAIAHGIEECVDDLMLDIDFTFERVAITTEQIDRHGLPTRPTKTTDSRAKNFDGESVEVDALPPAVLRALCDRTIRKHVDPERLHTLEAVEHEERLILQRIAEGTPRGDES